MKLKKLLSEHAGWDCLTLRIFRKFINAQEGISEYFPIETHYITSNPDYSNLLLKRLLGNETMDKWKLAEEFMDLEVKIYCIDEFGHPIIDIYKK